MIALNKGDKAPPTKTIRLSRVLDWQMTLIIFDCDGVLIDSEALALEIEITSLKEIGLEFDIEKYQTRHLGTSATEFFREISVDYQKKFHTALPNDFREKVKARYKAAFSTKLLAMPGVNDTLSTIIYPMAVASGSSPYNLKQKLDLTKLSKYFNGHLYSSLQVKRGKPAPDLFLFVANRLNTKPSNCIVIEDSIKGIRAAVDAGMRAIGFTGGSHCLEGHSAGLVSEGAVSVVTHMKQLKDAL